MLVMLAFDSFWNISRVTICAVNYIAINCFNFQCKLKFIAKVSQTFKCKPLIVKTSNQIL